ncbi:MAG: exodeoxyribonuclease VII large subunit [Paludibacter sp.]|nr:MAG: exodeoxyribonuclease VII large subunit [Paludibacter sp.]
MQTKFITLSQLNSQVKEVIKANFTRLIWVRAEISEFTERNGHAYFELIEKDGTTDKIIAKSRVTCWRSVFGMIKPYFESTTGESLRAGLEVLVAVSVEFSELYGMSLNMQNIDPSFTLGNLAVRRLEIIQQLKADGIFNMNKEVEFPLIPRRLAIVSSEKAAGYGDFCHQLENNHNGFSFYKKLFPAIVQGEKAEQSIISALDKIYGYSDAFDVVLILRGGGAVTDLACFDSYQLAMNVAQFPIPVLTGIGHQRDTSVVDLVAHRSLKTPTAVADFLLGKMQDNSEQLDYFSHTIQQILRNKLETKNNELRILKNRVESAFNKNIVTKNYVLKELRNRLIYSVRHLFKQENNKLQLWEYKIESNSPQKMLERGVSITYVNGKKIESVKNIRKGDKVKTYLKDGNFESIVS